MSTMQVTRIITEYSPALNGKPGVKRPLHEILLLYPMIPTLAPYQLESGLAMLQNFLPERLVRSISQNSYEKWRFEVRQARRRLRKQMEPSRTRHKHRSQGGDLAERGSHAPLILLGTSTKPSVYSFNIKHILKLYCR